MQNDKDDDDSNHNNDYDQEADAAERPRLHSWVLEEPIDGNNTIKTNMLQTNQEQESQRAN